MRRPLRRRLAGHPYSPAAWALLFALATASAAAWHGGPQREPTYDPTPLGAAYAGQSAAFLPDGDIVWRPASAAAGLARQAVNGARAQTIVAYPDVQPVEWHVAPAQAGAFHLIWVESRGEIRSALIGPSGETKRGPIQLGAVSPRAMVSVPLKGSQVLVAWFDPAARRLVTITIDEEGRPGPPKRPLAAPIGGFALAVDPSGDLHAAWWTSTTPQRWTLHYAAGSPAQPQWAEPRELLTLTLDRRETLGSLALALTADYGYVLWGVADGDAPGGERLEWLSFARAEASAAAGQPTVIVGGTTESEPSGGEQLALAAGASSRPQLRRAGDGGASSRPVAQRERILVAARRGTPAGWQPGIAEFGMGQLLGFTPLAPARTLVSGPVVAVTQDHQPLGAWLSLDGARPELVVAAARSDTSSSCVAKAPLRSALEGLLVALPLTAMWLLVPTVLLLAGARPRWTLALGAHTLGVLLWPPGLLSHIPAPVCGAAASLGDPRLAVGSLLLLSGFAASAALAGAVRTGVHPARAWFVYSLVHLVIVTMLFGSNLIA